ncbi:hypothetical protein DID88_005441 [Monilinia fructigena]|uniref:Major facilitator superfamily (MFS) profile domain-containing protein n=1 Tax=Monilinia fructigena TaxID=38457 RepID=A0A395J0L2_9HELO|nr:hypothetical protein DID88_005441 [Monilinia fructigena]
MGLLSHTGFLGDSVQGAALESLVCATAASGFLLFGYDQGIMSGIITEDNFLTYFPQMEPHNKSGAIQALVVAIYEIGSSSFGMAQLIVGRIVTGVGNGMNTSSIPVWQSEMAPPKIRGFLVLFEGALIAGGIMLSYWLNYGFFFITKYGSFQWRFPIAFQGFFGMILLVGILALPESPKWLLKKDKDDHAIEILCRLQKCERDDPRITEEVRELKRIGGTNLVTYYATTVFEDSLGFSPSLARLLTACYGTLYLAAAIFRSFYCRPLWPSQNDDNRCSRNGSLGHDHWNLSLPNNPGLQSSRLRCYRLHLHLYCLLCCWMAWYHMALSSRSKHRSVSELRRTVSQLRSTGFGNYLVVQLAPIMIYTISWKTYFVFMCINLAFVPIIWYTFVETKGYPLEQLDKIFEEAYEKGENPVWTERRIRKNAKLLQDGGRQAEEGVSTGTDLGDEEKTGRESRNENVFADAGHHHHHDAHGGESGTTSGSDTVIEQREKTEEDIDMTDRFPHVGN